MLLAVERLNEQSSFIARAFSLLPTYRVVDVEKGPGYNDIKMIIRDSY